jgi:hypothetical protein
MDEGMARATASIRERLGELHPDEDLSDDDIARGIDAFQDSARSFGISVDDMGQAFASIGEALVGVAPAAALGFRDDPPRDYLDTLIDLARAGDESTFKDLARSVGVRADHVDALWTRTTARARAAEGR